MAGEKISDMAYDICHEELIAPAQAELEASPWRGQMGQILFSPGLRMMGNGPHTEKQDHECNTQDASQEDTCRLQVKPIPANGPEQDHPD